MGRRYNGPGNYWDEAYGIAVDNNGNVYVTGRSYGEGDNYDYATIKYNSNGQIEWIRRYNGLGNGSDEAKAIAVDNNGNVYVTGRSYGGEATADDWVTIKYSPNGEELWVRSYNGPANGTDWANALAIDNDGNVYVTGRSDGEGTSADYATIKYNSKGQELWVARYNGPGNYTDEAIAIAVDNDNNIYVTGWSYGLGTDYDYATIKYPPMGKIEERNLIYSNLLKNEISNLKIYDILGKIVNPKNLKPGIYFMETKEERKVIIVK